MTDFFTSLAARSIATPSLRPRTRFRYEPPTEGEALPRLGEAIQSHETAPAPVRAAVSRDPLPAFSPSERFESPHPAPRQVHEERPEEAAASHREITTERVFDRRVEHEQTTLRHVDQRTERETLEMKHVVVTHDGEVIRPSAKPHRYDEDPPRIERESRSKEATPAPESTKPASPEKRRQDTPPLTRIERADNPTPTTPAAHRSVPPLVERRSAAAASNEPSIQVTIGRVEVRAVTPSVTGARTPRKSTAMTIDDYIAKRREKGRR